MCTCGKIYMTDRGKRDDVESTFEEGPVATDQQYLTNFEVE